MAFEIKGITGSNPYIWFQLARGTREGHSIEYNQFVERFQQGDGEPVIDSNSVAGSFYLDESDDTLWFRRTNDDGDPDTDDPDTWVQIAGGSALQIFDSPTNEVADAATRLIFTGDGVTVTETSEDSNLVTIDIPGGGGGTDLTVTAGTDSVSMVSNIELSSDYFTVATGSPDTTAVVTINNVVADGASGLMTGADKGILDNLNTCLLYTSPSPRDRQKSRMPSSA